MFPKNTWHVACTSNEVAEKPLGREICNIKIVFYRGAEGRAVPLEDFLSVQLSLGSVQGGQLVCGCQGLMGLWRRSLLRRLRLPTNGRQSHGSDP